MVETPPKRVRLQLLDTARTDLPDGLAEQVGRACEPVIDVRAAYIARQLETPEPDGPSVEVFTVALELERSPAEPGEPRTGDVIQAVLQELPKIGNRKGVAVLAEAALPVWQKRGVRVFERS